MPMACAGMYARRSDISLGCHGGALGLRLDLDLGRVHWRLTSVCTIIPLVEWYSMFVFPLQ